MTLSTPSVLRTYELAILTPPFLGSSDIVHSLTPEEREFYERIRSDKAFREKMGVAYDILSMIAKNKRTPE